MKTAVFLLLASLLISGCSVHAEDEKTIQLIQATDLHYLSPSLYNRGSAFQSLMNNGDGKLTEAGDAIIDRLLKQAEEKHADALILSGDLTFNGEYRSLLDLKEKLLDLQNSGIPVLVIPGNHDISYPYARSYIGDAVEPVRNISSAQFKEVMSCFGYDDAIYQEPSSFSYCYELNENLWLLFLDANTEEAPGALTDDELAFAETVLQKAARKNVRVIAVSHQNILPQSGLLSDGFVIENHEDIAALLQKYHVTLSLSGHSHLQHQNTVSGLSDICTESLSVTPLQDGLITVYPDGWSYHNETLGILSEQAEARFRTIMRKQLNASLEDTDIPAARKEEMIRYGIRLNLTYFAGRSVTELLNDPALQLWEEYGSDTFWYQYLKSMKEGM
jgi:predicted MPP superfamily phosphohydrolase